MGITELIDLLDHYEELLNTERYKEHGKGASDILVIEMFKVNREIERMRNG